ncbi:TRAP transporter large permease subunit, partial [Hydrogenovibrio sp. 3SP14C1]
VTPPFGSMMFTVCSILKVRMIEFMKEVIPFLIALLAVLMLLTFSESLVMWLPNAI